MICCMVYSCGKNMGTVHGSMFKIIAAGKVPSMAWAREVYSQSGCLSFALRIPNP